MLDPHGDVLEKASEVFPNLRAFIRDAPFVMIRAGKHGKCRTCGRHQELRYGHCFGCAEDADPGTTPPPK